MRDFDPALSALANASISDVDACVAAVSMPSCVTLLIEEGHNKANGKATEE